MAQRHNALVAPERCESLTCKGKNFQVVQEGSVQTDYQEAIIQESASQLVGSHVPKSLMIKLQHDLVDRCQPGDEVIVVGNLISQWHQSAVVDVDCPVGMALEAHSIRVVQDKSASAWTTSGPATELDDDKYHQEFVAYWADPNNLKFPIAARDHICKAVCPKLYGLAIVKLALLMTLIGGICQADHDRRSKREGHNPNAGNNGTLPSSAADLPEEPEQFQIIQNEQASGQESIYYGGEGQAPTRPEQNRNESVQTRRRGQSHLLLVGDPGTVSTEYLLSVL